MNYKFDIRGNLRPYDLIECSMEDFSKEFCSSPNRILIFQQFEIFLIRLKALLPDPCEFWIDGSFITKKTNPADIDLVVFIDFQYFITIKDEMRQLFKDSSQYSIKLVDAYPVIFYPENHPNHSVYRSDCLYWLHFFGKTRPNRAEKQFSKGIIKIIV